MRYDLVIIGTDEAGIEAAIVADEMLLRVALIAPQRSWTLQRALAGSCVDSFTGNARFLNPREIVVQQGSKSIRLQTDTFLIATGSRSARPTHIPFDGRTILDADEMRRLQRPPRSLTLIGGDADGIELAMQAARRGTKVTIVDSREQLDQSMNAENFDRLLNETDRLDIDCRSNEQVIGFERNSQAEVTVQLASGQRISSEVILFSAGRVGNTEGLNLGGVGVETDERGQLWCNDNQQTWAENIYGAGDVVGFPLPPQLPVQQGRHIVMHAFGQSTAVRQPTVSHVPHVTSRRESHQATAL